MVVAVLTHWWMHSCIGHVMIWLGSRFSTNLPVTTGPILPHRRFGLLLLGVGCSLPVWGCLDVDGHYKISRLWLPARSIEESLCNKCYFSPVGDISVEGCAREV